MDLGLGNLSDVKGFVLPQPMWADTQYDSVLATIAAGVAGRFELYCNRKLGYVANDQAVFDARRQHYLLPRYPIVSIALLEMNDTAQDDWTDITTTIVQQDLRIGWIYFGCYVGDPICMVRCTYTGGFWYPRDNVNTAFGIAEADPGYTPDAPASAALMPAALKHAWLIQVLHEFKLKDSLLPEGLSSSGSGHRSSGAWRLDQMQLLPEVQNAINQYRRMQIVS